MNNISFTSYLRAVNSSEFATTAIKAGSQNHVNYPWTLDDSVKAPIAYTRAICDCSVLGITDGQDVLLLHLNPELKVSEAQIEKYIGKRMNLKDSNLQAIVIGGKENPISQKLSEKFVNITNKLGLPLTELRITKDYLDVNVAYNSIKDEWLINNKKIDKLLQFGIENSMEIFENIFNKIKIADCDEVV